MVSSTQTQTQIPNTETYLNTSIKPAYIQPTEYITTPTPEIISIVSAPTIITEPAPATVVTTSLSTMPTLPDSEITLQEQNITIPQPIAIPNTESEVIPSSTENFQNSGDAIRPDNEGELPERRIFHHTSLLFVLKTFCKIL